MISTSNAIASRRTELRDQRLLDEKWKLLERRAAIFGHVPFVDFALASGSMALGTARASSDFDIIVGARGGRIFMARFLCIVAFELCGWRRAKHEYGKDARNKICLSHFTAPDGYRFAPPHSEAWRAMYRGLVPLVGNRTAVAAFFSANEWAWHNHGGRSAAMRDTTSPRRWRMWNDKKSTLKRVGEVALGGWMGDMLETSLRKIQVNRIKQSKVKTAVHEPRIIYTDSELMFFPNTTSRLTDYEC